MSSHHTSGVDLQKNVGPDWGEDHIESFPEKALLLRRQVRNYIFRVPSGFLFHDKHGDETGFFLLLEFERLEVFGVLKC